MAPRPLAPSVFLGSKGETAGNQHCQLLPDENGQFRLSPADTGGEAMRGALETQRCLLLQ